MYPEQEDNYSYNNQFEFDLDSLWNELYPIFRGREIDEASNLGQVYPTIQSNEADQQHYQTAQTSGLLLNLYEKTPRQVAVFRVSVKTKNSKEGELQLSNHSPKLMMKIRTLCVELPANCPQCVVKFSCEPYPEGSPRGQIFLSLRGKSKTIQKEEMLVPHKGSGEIQRELVRAEKDKLTGHARYMVCISVTINNVNYPLHNFKIQPKKDHKWETGKSGRKHNAKRAWVKECVVEYI